MKSDIKIKFLSLDEMANARDIDWRYENVGIDNLGFADKLRNRVYVRAGLDTELTKYLVDHEVSHLFEMEGTDEDEHGIRHKKKNSVVRTIVPIAAAILGSILLPGVGTYLGGSLGGILGGATGVGLGAGLGNVAGNSIVGKPNWLGGAITGTAAGIGSGIGGALSSVGGGAAGGGASAGGSGIGGALGSGISEVGSSGGGSFLGAGGAFGGAGASGGWSAAAPAVSGGSNLSSMFGGALGAGASAYGSSRPTSSEQSFQIPGGFSMGDEQVNPQYSGWGDTVAMPDQTLGAGYGMSGFEGDPSALGSAGMGQMPTDPGLGQAGINLSGQDVGAGFGQQQGAMDQMFGNQQQPYNQLSF